MSIVSKSFTGNGSTKTFQSDFKVLSENHIEVFIDSVLVSKSDYDTINNAAVFKLAPAAGSAVVVRVGTTPDDLVVSTTNIDTVAANITDINTVEDNLIDITTVAGSISSVNTVAANVDSVNTVASVGTDNLNGIVSNLANINTVGNLFAEIANVAGSIEKVNIVSDNIDDVNNFADTYLGVKTNDPTVDNDGNTLKEGALYWNSDYKQMRVWSGTAWVPMSTGSGASGGGVDQVFYENDQAVTTSYSITSGKNAMSAGPITIDDGVSVAIPSGSTWTVV